MKIRDLEAVLVTDESAPLEVRVGDKIVGHIAMFGIDKNTLPSVSTYYTDDDGELIYSDHPLTPMNSQIKIRCEDMENDNSIAEHIRYIQKLVPAYARYETYLNHRTYEHIVTASWKALFLAPTEHERIFDEDYFTPIDSDVPDMEAKAAERDLTAATWNHLMTSGVLDSHAEKTSLKLPISLRREAGKSLWRTGYGMGTIKSDRIVRFNDGV